MNDALDFDRAAARIARTILYLAGAGTAVAWGVGGWRVAAGFLVGAAASWLNFHGLKRLVVGLGGGGAPGGIRFPTRFLLLAGGAYVILRYSAISAKALFAGFFVMIAAVFVETAFEIYYASGKRTLDHPDL